MSGARMAAACAALWPWSVTKESFAHCTAALSCSGSRSGRFGSWGRKILTTGPVVHDANSRSAERAGFGDAFVMIAR